VNGPGKLCFAMKIDRSHNTHDVTKGSEIYLIEGDDRPFEIVVSKRINIDYAGESKDKPWRFYIKDNMYVSVKGVIVEIITPLAFTHPIDEQLSEASPKTASLFDSLDKYKAPSTQSTKSTRSKK